MKLIPFKKKEGLPPKSPGLSRPNLVQDVKVIQWRENHVKFGQGECHEQDLTEDA